MSTAAATHAAYVASLSATTNSVAASPMQVGSVITEVVNNLLNGTVYLSLRNDDGEEFTQLFPVRMEKIYTHEWKLKNWEVIDYEESKNGYFEITSKAFCKFKINGAFTHAMNVQVMPSLFYQNFETSTVRLMPFNIEVLEGVHNHYKFDKALVEFIENAFPALPTTYIHNYEGMKLSEDTLIGHKRRRDEMLGGFIINDD